MSSDNTLRDGKRAIELAKKALKLSVQPNADVLDALANAYAEASDFEKAIDTEKKAIDLASKENRDKRSRDWLLKLYESHHPFHELKPTKSEKIDR